MVPMVFGELYLLFHLRGDEKLLVDAKKSIGKLLE